MVDMSKAKVGDTVVDREGSNLVIETITVDMTMDFPYQCTFTNQRVATYKKDGSWKSAKNIFDIVQIIPKKATRTVGLSKAKAGDTVKFRGGGAAIIQKINKTDGAYPWVIEFENAPSPEYRYNNAGIPPDADGNKHPNSIMKITFAKVDLSKCKAGDILITRDGREAKFIEDATPLECKDGHTYPYRWETANGDWGYCMKDGTCYVGQVHRSDIVKVKKAKVAPTPEKPKMTVKEFVNQCGGVIHNGIYKGDGVFVVYPKDPGGTVTVYEKEDDAYAGWVHANTSFTIANAILKLLKG